MHVYMKVISFGDSQLAGSATGRQPTNDYQTEMDSAPEDNQSYVLKANEMKGNPTRFGRHLLTSTPLLVSMSAADTHTITRIQSL